MASYFDSIIRLGKARDKYFKNNEFKLATNSGPKYSEEIWAQLMLNAIHSFNNGLENKIGVDDNKIASLRSDAIDIAGEDAVNTIMMLAVYQARE